MDAFQSDLFMAVAGCDFLFSLQNAGWKRCIRNSLLLMFTFITRALGARTYFVVYFSSCVSVVRHISMVFFSFSLSLFVAVLPLCVINADNWHYQSILSSHFVRNLIKFAWRFVFSCGLHYRILKCFFFIGRTNHFLLFSSQCAGFNQTTDQTRQEKSCA